MITAPDICAACDEGRHEICSGVNCDCYCRDEPTTTKPEPKIKTTTEKPARMGWFRALILRFVCPHQGHTRLCEPLENGRLRYLCENCGQPISPSQAVDQVADELLGPEPQRSAQSIGPRQLNRLDLLVDDALRYQGDPDLYTADLKRRERAIENLREAVRKLCVEIERQMQPAPLKSTPTRREMPGDPLNPRKNR